MKNIGRLLVRDGLVGLYIPHENTGDMSVEPGLYQLEIVLGELTLRYIGVPAMDSKRLNGLDLHGLSGERQQAMMTKRELIEHGIL